MMLLLDQELLTAGVQVDPHPVVVMVLKGALVLLLWRVIDLEMVVLQWMFLTDMVVQAVAHADYAAHIAILM